MWTWTAIDADNRFAVSWSVGAMPSMRTSSCKTWRVSPAIASGVTKRLWEHEDIIRITDEYEATRKALRSN